MAPHNETVIGVAGTNTIIRHWNNFGRTTGYSLVGRVVPNEPHRQSTLAYDPATGRLASMQIPSEQSNNPDNQTITQFTWSYLPGSDLKSSLAYPNGLSASWQYDANSQLLQVCNAFPTNVISQYDYAYDAAGRRVQITRSGSAMSETRTDVYGYNARSELISAAKLGGSQSSATEYAYSYDDIGNRITSLDLGTNRTYTANNLNQYTLVGRGDPTAPQEEFVPQFDLDGNQTRIKTATGIWSVTYNGENRPIFWACIQSDNQTITNNQTISMSFDRMGRRVKKNDQRFVYDGYLQIANFEHQTSNIKLQTFIWDPTEPIATRPLAWLVLRSLGEGGYYTHDGNKNVSEVIASDGALAAHFDYAPFGAITAQCGTSAASNPWRFSSEYTDDALGLVYYNYRHYDWIHGRWLRVDPVGNGNGDNMLAFTLNQPLRYSDRLGLLVNDVEVVVSPVLPILEERCNRKNARHYTESDAPQFVVFTDYETSIMGVAYVPSLGGYDSSVLLKFTINSILTPYLDGSSGIRNRTVGHRKYRCKVKYDFCCEKSGRAGTIEETLAESYISGIVFSDDQDLYSPIPDYMNTTPATLRWKNAKYSPDFDKVSQFETTCASKAKKFGEGFFYRYL